MGKLIGQTLSAFLMGAVVLGLLTFLPAWTIDYWQAWVFIVVFMVSVTGVGLYLTFNDPALLERRKKVGPAHEQSIGQKIVISVGFLSIIGIFVFSGVSHRFGWSPVPGYTSWIGDLLVAFGLFVNVLVFRANTYGGSTIETVADQKVISTGPYTLIRHPMYVGVLIMIIGIPLALDAWWGLGILALTLPGLMWRILDEERLLKTDLPGYEAYTHKVRYRLVPFVW